MAYVKEVQLSRIQFMETENCPL